MRRWVTMGAVLMMGQVSPGLLERGTASAAPSKAEGFASCIDALRERLIPFPEVTDDDAILEPGDLPREKLGAFGTPPDVRVEVMGELNAKAKGIPWIRWGSGPRPKEIRVRVDATDKPHAWTPRGLELTEMHPAFVHVLELGGDHVAVIGLSENPMTSRTVFEMKTKGRWKPAAQAPGLLAGITSTPTGPLLTFDDPLTFAAVRYDAAKRTLRPACVLTMHDGGLPRDGSVRPVDDRRPMRIAMGDGANKKPVDVTSDHAGTDVVAKVKRGTEIWRLGVTGDRVLIAWPGPERRDILRVTARGFAKHHLWFGWVDASALVAQ